MPFHHSVDNSTKKHCLYRGLTYNDSAFPSMSSAIHIIPQLTRQHFLEMEALELRFYGEEFITPPEEAWHWYTRHPHSAVAAEMNGRLAGFVNLFPVQPEVYQALREGRFNDHFMVLDDVADMTVTLRKPGLWEPPASCCGPPCSPMPHCPAWAW